MHLFLLQAAQQNADGGDLLFTTVIPIVLIATCAKTGGKLYKEVHKCQKMNSI